MGRISAMAVLTSFFQPFVRFHPQTCKMGLRKTKKLCCFCRQGQQGYMVCCDSCEQWFHGSCVGASKASAWMNGFEASANGEDLDQQPNNAEFMQLQQDLKECREKKMVRDGVIQFKRQIETLEQSIKEKDLELSEIKKANVKLALDLTECCQTMVKDLELAALNAANIKLTHDLTQCQSSQKIDNLRQSNSIQKKLSKSSTQPAPKEEKKLSIIVNANKKSSKLSLKKSLSQPQQCPVKKYIDDED
ncbi:Death-inducer obliterator 1 [Frankliniella fusca]|uniref:Death-inducer obliterator 1 n=1 Tax=Frankliniella fusca TaxID=407009 RepID=A0AAE1H4P0_9NEOP|nr:Death-inducer obliterator 1 [Frankliniella fusca]